MLAHHLSEVWGGVVAGDMGAGTGAAGLRLPSLGRWPPQQADSRAPVHHSVRGSPARNTAKFSFLS